MASDHLRVGKPVRVSIPCAGLEPGQTVTVKVFELHGLGGDPIETFDATVDDTGALATASWTYDHAKHADSVASARFLLVAEGAGRATASQEVEFFDLFTAKVKDRSGTVAAHRRILLHPDRGAPIASKTDAGGTCRELVPPGSYHVEVLGPLPPEERIPAPEAAGPPPEADTPDAPDDASPAPATEATPDDGADAEDAAAPEAAAPDDATPAPANDFFVCLDLPGPHFEFDRSFIRPSVSDSLAPITQALDADPTRVALVFGHTDEVGTDDYNKALSERRAHAAFALLTHDTTVWEQLYSQESWGIATTQQVLGAVGYPVSVTGVNDHETQEAVKSFQGDHGLAQDGIAGHDTRAALYQAYFEGLHPAPIDAARFTGFQFMGCGEFNVNVDTEAPEERNRRVIVFVYAPDAAPKALPCQRGSTAPCRAHFKDPPGTGRVATYRCQVYDDFTKVCGCEGEEPPNADELELSLHVPTDACELVTLDGDAEVARTPASAAEDRGDDVRAFDLQHLEPPKTYRLELRDSALGLVSAWSLSPGAYRKAAAAGDTDALEAAFHRVET